MATITIRQLEIEVSRCVLLAINLNVNLISQVALDARLFPSQSAEVLHSRLMLGVCFVAPESPTHLVDHYGILTYVCHPR